MAGHRRAGCADEAFERSSPDPRAGRRGERRRRASSSRSRARAASSSRPPGFLPAGRRLVHASNGILFIADEIQTGFCRTGDWFACEHEGVVPDLITTAKGIAGGLPLAAVTGRADLMDAVHAGGLGGTYGGNPVACAAALGAIETMRELDLARRAPARSRRSCSTGCAPCSPEHRRDRRRPRPRRDDRHRAGQRRGTTEPDAALTAAIAKACHAEGVVVLTARHLRQRAALPAAAGHRHDAAQRGPRRHRAGLRHAGVLTRPPPASRSHRTTRGEIMAVTDETGHRVLERGPQGAADRREVDLHRGDRSRSRIRPPAR